MTVSVYSESTFRCVGSEASKEHNAILAVGGAFAREHADFFVGRRADVIHEARVHLHRIERFGIRGIGNIVGVYAIGDC